MDKIVKGIKMIVEEELKILKPPLCRDLLYGETTAS